MSCRSLVPHCHWLRPAGTSPGLPNPGKTKADARPANIRGIRELGRQVTPDLLEVGRNANDSRNFLSLI
jgi:hypothetical protein